ncbi:uncharacterized protein DFL_000101 [Arthrobotrys flagrans]|uniref:F-box domain-containing protein n=1 Tax=Arthrobotrys flagrans TaxID=97331 RepID=A0A437ACT4_ARTFL|nr:hypothetical protein DFL_000101 [Arthrobotrys flagrans]
MSKATTSQNNATAPRPPAPPSPKALPKPDLPPELTPFLERKGNIEAGMFVNIDTEETMIYPLQTNQRFPDLFALRKEQWAIRKAFVEMMLDRELSERYKISRLHNQITRSLKEDPDAIGRLSWLPSGVLFRIFNQLDPLSLLALAVTSTRFLKSTALHVRDVILPPHVGSWAGNRVQYVHLIVDSSLHIQRRGRTTSYIENHVNYQRWTKENRIIEPPRSFYLTLDYKRSRQAEKLLARVMEHVERFPARLAAVREFVNEIRYSDEFWLSFHREKKYWLHKTDNHALDSGEITIFDLHKWTSPNGPSRMDEDSLPSSVFRRREAWRIVPCEDNQDDILELAPLQRGERRQRMIEDIFLRDEGGRLSKIPREGTDLVLAYRSNPDSRRKFAQSKQCMKKALGARRLFMLLALCWAIKAGVFPELWYFITLGLWLLTGKEIEGGIVS